MSARALHLTPKPAVDVIYPKGSIVVCLDCGKPIYRLQQSIYYGEPVGKSAWKFVPVEMADLQALIDRNDLEPGQRAAVKAMSLADRVAHCQKIPTLKAGDFMDCPACKKQFSYGIAPDTADGAKQFADKGYQVELTVIPPAGQARPVRQVVV